MAKTNTNDKRGFTAHADGGVCCEREGCTTKATTMVESGEFICHECWHQGTTKVIPAPQRDKDTTLFKAFMLLHARRDVCTTGIADQFGFADLHDTWTRDKKWA